MSTVGWIILGVIAWFAVALATGLIIGRVIRNRDRQAPVDTAISSDGRPYLARRIMSGGQEKTSDDGRSELL